MWEVQPPSQRWDWDTLRASIAQHGVRNSLLVAPMPTASTSQVSSYLASQLRPLHLLGSRNLWNTRSDTDWHVLQILGNNECFEPYTSNIYVRRVLSGEFTVVNQHLLSDLVASGLWSADTKNELVAANGSVQVGLSSSHMSNRSAPDFCNLSCCKSLALHCILEAYFTMRFVSGL